MIDSDNENSRPLKESTISGSSKESSGAVRAKSPDRLIQTGDAQTPGLYYLVLAAAILFYLADLLVAFGPKVPLSHGLYFLSTFMGLDIPDVFELLDQLSYYPPLFYLITALIYFAWGADYLAQLIVHAAWLPLAAVYLTALAGRLGLGRLAFLPGVLLLLCPGAVMSTRSPSFESLLVLMTTAAAYHLVAADRFRLRKHCLLAGIWIGLGLLTKWTILAYLSGLAFWLAGWWLSQTLKQAGAGKKLRQPVNLLLTVGVAAAISLWWYLLRLDWATFRASAANDPNQLVHSFALLFVEYLNGLSLLVLGPNWWLGGAIFLTCFLLARKRLTLTGLAGLGLVVPLVLFSLPVHGETRYLIPLLPAACLLLGACLAWVRWPSARIAAALLIIAAMSLAHFAFIEREMTREHNLREHVIGDYSEADLLARTFLAADPQVKREEIIISAHPFLNNIHIHCEYLRYYIIRRGAGMLTGLFCPNRFEYAAFHKDLRALFYDVILIDCADLNDCLEKDRREFGDWIEMFDRYGYVNQMLGLANERFSLSVLEEDLEFIRVNYRPFLHLPLSDGSHTRIWVRPGLLPEREPAEEQPLTQGGLLLQ